METYPSFNKLIEQSIINNWDCNTTVPRRSQENRETAYPV